MGDIFASQVACGRHLVRAGRRRSRARGRSGVSRGRRGQTALPNNRQSARTRTGTFGAGDTGRVGTRTREAVWHEPTDCQSRPRGARAAIPRATEQGKRHLRCSTPPLRRKPRIVAQLERKRANRRRIAQYRHRLTHRTPCLAGHCRQVEDRQRATSIRPCAQKVHRRPDCGLHHQLPPPEICCPAFARACRTTPRSTTCSRSTTT